MWDVEVWHVVQLLAEMIGPILQDLELFQHRGVQASTVGGVYAFDVEVDCAARPYVVGRRLADYNS